MTRNTLPEARIHPAIRETIATRHADLIEEVDAATREHAIVVVCLAWNTIGKKVRKLLDGRQTPYRYLEYGNYLNNWRRRNALKMWTGWPTFPMVFVHGVLIGGGSDLAALAESGELDALLAAERSDG